MNCAQVKEQLLDFLYGELPAAARGSFAEHLEGCPACKAEVASFGKTLGLARAALAGPLAQEPPARVHLAAIESAKAAAKAAPRTSVASQDEPGFLTRLLRTPWFLPAFGAASIATVVFLVRVLKNPEVLPGQHPHSVEERSLAAPEPVLAPAPNAEAAVAAQAKAAKNLAEAKAPGVAGGDHKSGAKGGPARDRPATSVVRGKRAISDDPLSGLGSGEGRASGGAPSRYAEPPPPRQSAPKHGNALDDLLSDVKKRPNAQPDTRSAAAAGVGRKARMGGDEDRLDGLAGESSAPTKKSAPPERAAELEKSAAQPARGYPAESPASASAPPAPGPASRRKEMQKAEAAPQGSLELDDYGAAKDKVVKGSGKAGPSLEDSLRKAERLYASEAWNAAAEAYRDLLRRFPGHKDATRWRDRINESLVAEKQRQARLKKAKKTSDTLDGLKL